MSNKTVGLGMSGGVDSSVAGERLSDCDCQRDGKSKRGYAREWC